ncbi:TPA: hypothetical protein ACK3Q6_007497 [Burkholderia cepacia]|uniref:hypothetical protein n=1 Tax=Burkholderia cepacia TaxID=292 RepID=UPI001CF3BCE7|nr:hypothetical protein [Burkholderia cepacia]HDR9769553.1 hypothetical protein [Burkholderia cepacia ATCC 25416]MCA8361289.1 hypothetical protein [Burkholderia cepacia]HDR9779909.1 hypothetical protein [Burkholderia cepacia ATCC 25416]HDR9795831.1 hypothetical protein [Burkholderia cepacia ATCC 25416]HDV6371452.1 hypothetical protein [Burkholderia cepacia]
MNLTEEEKDRAKRRGIQFYEELIADYDDELRVKLNEEEWQFYKSIEDYPDGWKASRFLQMSAADRAGLMNGKFSKDEVPLVYKFGSTKALIYTNDAYMYANSKKIAKKLKNWTTWPLAASIGAFAVSFFLLTVGLNSQVRLELPGGSELVPGSFDALDNNKEAMNDRSNLMTKADYDKYISAPNFKCYPLKSLTESFRTPDGLPKCKTVVDKNNDEITWIVGYVLNPEYPDPIINIKHNGKIANFNLMKYGFNSAQLDGKESLRIEMLRPAMLEAFPDVMRASQADVITQNRDKSE